MSTVSELNKPFFQTIQTVRPVVSLDLDQPGLIILSCYLLLLRVQSFKDVSTTPGVETVGFANAAEGLVSIFGKYTAIIPVH
jgi:hypothetical protein